MHCHSWSEKAYELLPIPDCSLELSDGWSNAKAMQCIRKRVSR